MVPRDRGVRGARPPAASGGLEGVLAWINRALGGLFIYLGFRVAMLEAR